MRVSREGCVQGKSFHAAIPATRSRHLTDVILITCACFERELPIKVVIIGLCEHDTSFARNTCKLCTRVCSSCERPLRKEILICGSQRRNPWVKFRSGFRDSFPPHNVLHDIV